LPATARRGSEHFFPAQPNLLDARERGNWAVERAAIAASVIALAHSLQLKVVAEGVETHAQLLFLARQRCDEFQGFYFSRPLPATDFAALLQSNYQMPPPTLLQPGEGI